MKEGFTKTLDSYQNQDRHKTSIRNNLISKEVFVQLANKKRRGHSNSILNELKLSQKISHKDLFSKQQNSLKTLQKLRESSLRTLKNRNSMQQLNSLNFGQQSTLRISRFAEDKSPCLFKEQDEKNQQQQDLPHLRKDTQQPSLKLKTSIQDQTQNKTNKKGKTGSNKKQHFCINKIKRKNVKASSPSNKLLSSINNKLREIDIISKTFDQVNQSYNCDSNLNLTNYLPKKQKKFNLLQQFQSKLVLRKNMITQRKNSLKKNTIIDYRYKAFPRRLKTETDKQNQQEKYQGLWNQDACRMKNYISGGYSVQKEEFSDYCDLQDYQKLKKNFRTFDQIYSNIKEDKDNPVGKMVKTDRKNPTILQVVCAIQKQHKIKQSSHIKQ